VSGRHGFRRVLVANRGEIAARVIRTCRRLGIETVLTVSDADAGSLPARLADKTIRIGPPPAAASYLDVDAVVGAALAAGADAIHPGYGFLSENARLARACAAAGIVFIGPTPETLEATGDKLAAREHAVAAGLPVLPGGHIGPVGHRANLSSPVGHRAKTAVPGTGSAGGGGISGTAGVVGAIPPGIPGALRAEAAEAAGTAEAARLAGASGGFGTTDTAWVDGALGLAERIGFPVLIKAAGGGGGRGLRVVRDPAELAHAVAVASAEAGAAFGDPRVYLERYVSPARHVEVQLLGDGERVVHLGTRDCSVQRRYQKLIEEAPAPLLGDGLRGRLHAAAVAIGEHLRYRGAGTVEFLVDTRHEEFYFLEVNARIQVEHPVTEAITGLDLVEEQIAIAEGRLLRVRQQDVTVTGHAIECRINAEDPRHDFLPSPGTVTRAVFPGDPDVRVDTHVQAGATVPPHYDSLLAKVIAHGADRAAALAALRGALDRCAIDGVITNLDMHHGLLADPEFGKGGVDTSYLERWLAREESFGDGRETAAYVRDALLARGDDPPEPPARADSGVGRG
jgi:acetyl-CoA carboxylase, biotin carboxylase subunit